MLLKTQQDLAFQFNGTWETIFWTVNWLKNISSSENTLSRRIDKIADNLSVNRENWTVRVVLIGSWRIHKHLMLLDVNSIYELKMLIRKTTLSASLLMWRMRMDLIIA